MRNVSRAPRPAGLTGESAPPIVLIRSDTDCTAIVAGMITSTPSSPV